MRIAYVTVTNVDEPLIFNLLIVRSCDQLLLSMFENHKRAWYFSGVCNLCMRSFGIDPMAWDIRTDGAVQEIVETSRKENKTREEAAVTFLMAIHIELSSTIHEVWAQGQRPDFGVFLSQKKVVQDWSDRAKIDQEHHRSFISLLRQIFQKWENFSGEDVSVLMGGKKFPDQ